MTKTVVLEGGFPWGFRLEGDGTLADPVRISKIINKSKADTAGLRPGDVLLSVNDHSLSGLNSNEVMRIIREAGTRLTLGLHKTSSTGGRSLNISTSCPTKDLESRNLCPNVSLQNHKASCDKTITQTSTGSNSQDLFNGSTQPLNRLNHRHMDNNSASSDVGKNTDRISAGSCSQSSYKSNENDNISAPTYDVPLFESDKNCPNISHAISDTATLRRGENRDTLLRVQTSGTGRDITEAVDSRQSMPGRDDVSETGTGVSNHSIVDNASSHLPKIQMPTITLLKMTRGKDIPSTNNEQKTNSSNFPVGKSSNSIIENLEPAQSTSRSRDLGAKRSVVDESLSRDPARTVSKPNPSLSSPTTLRTKAQMTADWVLYGSETSRSIESDLSLMGNSENASSILPKDDSGYSDCDQAPLASPPEVSSESSTPRIAMIPSDRNIFQELSTNSTKKFGRGVTRNGKELRRSYSTASDIRSEGVGKRVQVEGDRRLIIYDGIGPTDAETGVPMAPRHSVEPKNQKEWYKCMYKSMHVLRRSGDDDVPFSLLQKSLDDSKAKFEPSRSRSRGNSVGEIYKICRATSSDTASFSEKKQTAPSGRGLNTTLKPATSELRSTNNHQKESWKPPDAKYAAEIYRNQPNSVQDYIPGVRSSLTSPRLTSSSLCSSPLDEILSCSDIKGSTHCQPNAGMTRRESSKSFSSQQTLSPGGHGGHGRNPSNGSNASVFSQANVKGTSPSPSSRSYSDHGGSKVQPLFTNGNGSQQRQQNSRTTSHLSQTCRKAMALYCYKATNECEISFEKGDTIHIYKKLDRSWYEGECNGNIGKFPASYVKILPVEDKSQSAGYSDLSGRESRMSSVSADVRESLGQVIHDFMAESSREMSLRIGDIVTITKKLDKNWYEGANGSQRGIFPVPCITILPESGYQNGYAHSRNGSWNYPETLEDSFQSSGTSASWRPDFSNFPPDSISVTADPYNYNPYTGMILDNEGSSYLENNNSSSARCQNTGSQPVTQNTAEQLQNGAATCQYILKAPLSQREHEICRVLYRYEPHNQDELELQEGDLVQVLDKYDDGWFLGVSQRSQRMGTFPSNYVHILRS